LQYGITRQYHVKYLGSPHFKRAFSEEESERIGSLIRSELKDALVHRVDNDLSAAVGGVLNHKVFAGLGFCGNIQTDPVVRFSRLMEKGTAP